MDTQPNQEHGLRHQLSAGQMAMLAVGGSIGTGLLLGSAAAMEIAGPGVILSFALAAFMSFTVTMALGELASVHPAAGSFGLYGELYLNQWAGFISRAAYWAAIAASVGAELLAASTYMAYWFPTVSALIWVVIFSIVLLLVNSRSVGNFGRFEYWFAMIKVVTIAAFIVIGAGLLMTGRVAAQFSSQGGFLPKGWFAPLLAMGFAMYTFGGIEMVVISSGESRTARDIPRAVLITFGVLTCLYMGAIIVLVAMEPCRRHREPICYRLSSCQDSGSAGHHELRSTNGRALRSQCCVVCLGAHAVLAGARRLGTPGIWTLKHRRIASTRVTSVILRNCRCNHFAEVGAQECFRFGPRGGACRNAFVLAGWPRCPR